jgi:hypothetical protein
MLAIAVVGLHALVELPHHYAYFLVPAALWAGIVEREERAPTWGRGVWMIAPAAIALTIFAGIARDYSAIEDDFRQVRLENSRIARATSPTVSAPWMSSLTGFLEFARTRPAPGMTDAQLRAMQASVERYPYVASLARYGSALAFNGRLAEATETYLKIRYIYGDRIYARIRSDLRERAESDEPGLAELARSLPSFDASDAQRR